MELQCTSTQLDLSLVELPKYDQLDLGHVMTFPHVHMTSVPAYHHVPAQPTLTQAVKWGISNDEPDYGLDYNKYQEQSSWNEGSNSSCSKSDIDVTSTSPVEFLEQNDMVPRPNPIPPESLNYLAEDDNSYLKFEYDLHLHRQNNLNNSFDIKTEASQAPCHAIQLQQFQANRLANSVNSSYRPADMDVDITSGCHRVFQSPIHPSSEHALSLQRLLHGLSGHDFQQFQAANSRAGLPSTMANYNTCFNALSSTFHHIANSQQAAAGKSGIRSRVKHPKIQLDTAGSMKRKYVKKMTKEEQIQNGNNLWQFLMRLLVSRKDVITWTGHDLEFRIVNKEEIARMWGKIKNREKMNFDKFSRALRYYYNKRILIHNPQCRLTYCFMRNPRDAVFCTMLQEAMRSIPNAAICNAQCSNKTHSHELQYAKRKIRQKNLVPYEARHTHLKQ